jgi:hypothetical protein
MNCLMNAIFPALPTGRRKRGLSDKKFDFCKWALGGEGAGGFGSSCTAETLIVGIANRILRGIQAALGLPIAAGPDNAGEGEMGGTRGKKGVEGGRERGG